MIIVRLKGGLGNQLFQYAVGRHLAEIHKSVLKIDISLFKTYKPHPYSLRPFNIREIIASSDEVLSLTAQKWGIVKRAARRLLRRPSKLSKTHIQEKQFHFDPEILNLPDGVYLDGYWQSEKYFAGISDIIRREFTIKIKPDAENERTMAFISNVNAVSLHVRRANYVSEASAAGRHGTCSIAYYQQAVEIIAQKVSSPHFFVFSDDISWAKENITLRYPTVFISHNSPANKDFEDLRLMAKCSHHITANSTFSWWGAWLNKKPDKIVIVPKKWFKKWYRDENTDTKDLIPGGWIRI
ncbi:MAG: alpha-1,2-fucosyltransferase [Candidatus Ratteibacteria bacterium]|jgi:hypothetical protein